MGGGPPQEHILIISPFPEPTAILHNLRNQHPHAEFTYLHQTPGTSVPTSAFKPATLLCTFATFPPSRSTAPHLRAIQLLSAGSNQIQSTWLWADTHVAIATASGIHGPQIAEWCLLTHLVHTHGYNQLYELQKAHKWGDRNFDAGKGESYHAVRDRVGLKVGVLGYGSIGRQVGRVAAAMGMRVLAYTATEKPTAESRRDKGFVVPGTGDVEGTVPESWWWGLEEERLREFLAQGLDWVVVSVPLTEQTRGLLGKGEFEVLGKGERKGSAFVTNIARGPIVDQGPLVAALKDGTLRGAALDVTDPEPLPEDSELWDLPNVTVTPHVSGEGSSYVERAFQVLGENVGRREKGDGLINEVRRGRGY